MEETETAEATNPEEAPSPRLITITIDNEMVKYDTNLPLSELLMWLQVVQTMVINKTVLGEGS